MAIGGLDVGTSGCKFVAYDTEGKVLCECKQGYREYGTDGIREIDPDEVWEAVVSVLRQAAAQCPEEIEGLAVTTLGESSVIVGGDGTPLQHSMVTGDKRGIDEARMLAELFGEDELMRKTGIPPSEMYALPKWMWTARHTDAIKRAKHIFLYEDYIAYRLTGRRAVSYSSASRTMAFDIHRKEWSAKLLAAANISSPSLLSEPVASGTVLGTLTKEAAGLTGLNENTMLVAGGHDQMCTALGSGVLTPDVCGDGMGTCEVMTAPLHEARTDRYMADHELACVPYVLPGTYLTYLVMTNCGILMNWYRDTFFPKNRLSSELRGSDILQMLDKETESEPTGLLVVPNFGSSGNPHVDYTAKGTVWGLTIHTKQHELFRAFKEGMAYHMKLCLETLAPLNVHPAQIRAAGGGAVSDVTLQIRADVFGVPVARLASREAGTLGCMMLAGMALGKYKDMEEAVRRAVHTEQRIFEPDRQRSTRYLELYTKYKELYELTRNFK